MSSTVLCYVRELLRCCVEQTDRFQIRGRDAAGPHADCGGARHETADSHRQEAVSCTSPVPLRCPSSTSQHWLSCTLHALARLPASPAVDEEGARPLKLHARGSSTLANSRGGSPTLAPARWGGKCGSRARTQSARNQLPTPGRTEPHVWHSVFSLQRFSGSFRTRLWFIYNKTNCQTNISTPVPLACRPLFCTPL